MEIPILIRLLSPHFPLDLNYRVNLPDTDIRSLLRSEPKKRNAKELLRFDQVPQFVSPLSPWIIRSWVPIAFVMQALVTA